MANWWGYGSISGSETPSKNKKSMSPKKKAKKSAKKSELKVHLLTNHGLYAVADKHRQKSMVGGCSCAVDNVGQFGGALQVDYGCQRAQGGGLNVLQQ